MSSFYKNVFFSLSNMLVMKHTAKSFPLPILENQFFKIKCTEYLYFSPFMLDFDHNYSVYSFTSALTHPICPLLFSLSFDQYHVKLSPRGNLIDVTSKLHVLKYLKRISFHLSPGRLTSPPFVFKDY